MSSYSDKTNVYALFLLESLGFIYLSIGQLEQSRQIGQVLLQGATRNRLAIMKNWGDYYPGVVCYHRNELEVAAQHFTQIVENRYTGQITAYRDAIAGLALIHQIQEERSKAWQMVESISQFDLEQRGSEDNRTRSLRARLLLLQGDLEGASRWADAFTDLPPDQPMVWLEEPQVTRVRVLVARGTDADLRLALQILDVLDEIVERTYNTRYKIEILALRALALGMPLGIQPKGKPAGDCRSQCSAEAGDRPGTAGGFHPGFCRSGQTYARDAAPDCEARSFRGADSSHTGGISRE